ncbi:MAG: hypothetical protein NC388_01645 [Clostridium sp.]|nr:hypothetical protein [Clostridium sp.]
MKRYACNLLYISPSQALRNAVVEVDADGSPVRWYPLCGEHPFTEWIGGVMFFLPVSCTGVRHFSGELPVLLTSAFREAGEGVSLRLWHIEGLASDQCCLSPSLRFRLMNG